MIIVQNPVASSTISWNSASMLLTLSRIPLGLCVVTAVLLGAAFEGVIALTIFVAVDIVDGVAARGLGQDDADRRGVDSIIDRVTVMLVLFSVSIQAPAMALPALVVAATGVVAAPYAT